jgi:hypothetical protein
MLRACEPELLDHLPPDDPRAIQSRRDLRRVNSCMGNVRFVANALNSFLPDRTQPRILEIGAGDGSFFLKVVKRLSKTSSDPTAILLDRQNLLTAATSAQFQDLGWQVKTVTADVFEWFQQATERGCPSRSGNKVSAVSKHDETLPHGHAAAIGTAALRNDNSIYDAIIANLFLHHFSNEQLTELFGLACQTTPLFVAAEPRRSRFPLTAGKLLWAIGCNSVSRHDAVVSIRAGFSGDELSAFWPKTDNWTCEEYKAGLFSHVFVARRGVRTPSPG